MIPDPSTDPTATASLLSHLYSSGAFLCLGILVTYLALKYASKHVAWLEVPGRAHYVTVALAVLAVFALPASQGTTPNTSMLMVAFGTAMSLLLPGAPNTQRSTQAGSALFGVMWLLATATMWAAIVAALAMPACTHAQVVAGENAAKACGIANGKSLLGSIASDLAAGGLAAAEAAIGSDKALAGLAGDAINCLVSVVVAVESAGTGSGSAIATSEAAPTRSALIVANGNAYLAKHGAK